MTPFGHTGDSKQANFVFHLTFDVIDTYPEAIISHAFWPFMYGTLKCRLNFGNRWITFWVLSIGGRGHFVPPISRIGSWNPIKWRGITGSAMCLGLGGRGKAGAHPWFSWGGPETSSEIHLPRKFSFSSDFVHFILEMGLRSSKIKKWGKIYNWGERLRVSQPLLFDCVGGERYCKQSNGRYQEG